jgi:uncharacterized membrane protein YhaH (DUF805 family)
MFLSLWSNQSPIGRLQYFKYLLGIGLMDMLFYSPGFFVGQLLQIDYHVSDGITIIAALLVIFRLPVSLILRLKNAFKRARDIENTNNINEVKWFLFMFFPILAIYGNLSLLFKKGEYLGTV